ncbi:MAG: PAS domain S-box protein [Elusimicrobia bacterium]|nr:PAS domain S-box protein [Elusimicrobiota bacterium]
MDAPFLFTILGWTAIFVAIVFFLLLSRQKARLTKVNEELSRSNQELSRINEKIGLVIETAHDAFVALDPDGFVTEWNRQAETVFGLTRDEAVGKKLGCVIIPPKQQSALKADIRGFFDQGQAPILRHQMEVTGVHKDGREFPVELSISVSRYKNAYSFNAFVRDITEDKRLERMKDDFINTVSHELRTPLAVIKGAVANLHDGVAGPLTEKQARVVASTVRNVARLSRLINDLLDLSRLESGRTRLHKTRFDFRALGDETLAIFRSEAESRKINVEVVSGVFAPIHADADMLLQVLSNLLSNALHYARRSVKISAQMETGDAPALHVCVEDDGMGIEEAHLPLLFSKFEQINRPRGGSGYKGTGLGLAICKEIIELHHGKIWAESSYGTGSKFHFVIPVS